MSNLLEYIVIIQTSWFRRMNPTLLRTGVKLICRAIVILLVQTTGLTLQLGVRSSKQGGASCILVSELLKCITTACKVSFIDKSFSFT